MAFTILQNSTTADATDVNENFLHVGQGSRLPMGGTSLENTTSVYDLGSSTYRWNDVYAVNIDTQDVNVTGSITASDDLWQLVQETNITVTASNFTMSGLNGDNGGTYKVIARVIGPTSGSTQYRMYMNADTSSANYGQQYVLGIGTFVSGSRNTAAGGVNVGGLHNGTTTTFKSFAEVICYLKTGAERTFLQTILAGAGQTYVYSIALSGQIWDNTSSTITSILFAGSSVNSIYPGSHFELWRRK